MPFAQSKWDNQSNRLVKHPRQLIYEMYHLERSSRSEMAVFDHHFRSVFHHWLNAIYNWVHGDTEWLTIQYVLQDFEDFLHLYDGVKLMYASNSYAYSKQLSSLHDMVNKKIKGRIPDLAKSCMSAYEWFKPYVDMQYSSADVSSFNFSDLDSFSFLEWVDTVSQYSFWSDSNLSKLKTSMVPIDMGNNDESLPFRMSEFLWSIDLLKNFILFCHYVVGEESSSLRDDLKIHLSRFDRLTESFYMNVFKHSQTVDLGFPGMNMKSLRYAKRLRTLLDQFSIRNLMIGVAELEDGCLIYGISGSGGFAKSIVEKVQPMIGTDVESAPVVADTSGYRRLVRVNEFEMKTHNGFECVESKLFQGAHDRGVRLIAMTVLWHGDTPKRYCLDHSELHHIARPCPGCVLNLRKYLLNNG